MTDGRSLLKLAALLERGDEISPASERVCRCMAKAAVEKENWARWRLRGSSGTGRGERAILLDPVYRRTLARATAAADGGNDAARAARARRTAGRQLSLAGCEASWAAGCSLLTAPWRQAAGGGRQATGGRQSSAARE